MASKPKMEKLWAIRCRRRKDGREGEASRPPLLLDASQVIVHPPPSPHPPPPHSLLPPLP